jgi:small-conductance mechanosensitive channel
MQRIAQSGAVGGGLSQRTRAGALYAPIAALCFGLCTIVLSTLAVHAQAPTSRSQIETLRLELQQIEATLQREALDDRRLGELRQRLEPVGQAIGEVIARELPLSEEIKARIEQLGPAPDAAKGQSESAEVARDRAENTRLFREADETLRLARALALRADQVGQAIADRRRQNFTRQILAQHPSIISPWLWFDGAVAFPKDVSALHFLTVQWAETIWRNLDWYEALMILLLGGAVLLVLPQARIWVETGSFRPDGAEAGESHPPMRKALRALRRLALATIIPGAALFLLDTLLDRFGVLPPRASQVMDALLLGLAQIAFLAGLSRAVLAPRHPQWRLMEMSSERAEVISGTLVAIASMVVFGRVVDALLAATVASLPLTLITRGAIAVVVALILAQGLRQAFGLKRQDARSATPAADRHPNPVNEPGYVLPLRTFGWVSVMATIGAALAGFIPLASFLVGQWLWISALILVAILALYIIEELVGAGLSSSGFLGSRVLQTTGMAPASLDQMSVLGSGALRLMLFIVLGMVALAPWGVDSASFLSTMRAAFFGFQVGGVTISLSTIALALFLFAVGYLITRAIQNWFDTHYLPRTTLDPGLQNSIRTILGYIGIVIASMIALSQLGLSLDKLTIVAGALSVGIGFGLKSIVENFISGLILLWERPIRVGDWIVVGDEQGTVKRINVRSTEIVTFDRASLIIPNSEFISGRVKNWVHADRTARIIIPVGVDYSADPQKVQSILRDAALAHRDVLSEPKPVVIFKSLGENGLDFELRCFTDVDSMLMTRSDLHFDIYRRLQEAGIVVSSPTRRLEITNLPPMVDPRVVVAPADDSKR